MRAWSDDDDVAGLAGAGADTAAFARIAILECSALVAEVAAGGATGIYKLFGSLPRAHVAAAALRAGFPPAILRAYLAMIDSMQLRLQLARDSAPSRRVPRGACCSRRWS